VGPIFVGTPVRLNMLNMPKSMPKTASKLSKVKTILESSATRDAMFKVIRSNIEIENCSIAFKFGTEFHHVTDDTLQMFKVRGQRSRSQRKVLFRPISSKNTIGLICDNGYVQRLQTWHAVVIKAEKSWRGSDGLKLQCIRNCHVFQFKFSI